MPTLNDSPLYVPPNYSGPIVDIDVDALIKSRMLVQANSGAGKSHTLRRVLEQTWGTVQHIVIDVEGEFHTLREQYDYVLAAPRGGDCVADTRSAALLARRLLELGTSAVIDIYELGTAQKRFVKLFIESLMAAPRDLWHPVMVVVDEAHKFCAEKEDAESSAAVIDLMTRGRKRGFCGILATQRLSKLDKDAAAEANNLLIGRTALDLDVTRASTVLGMSVKDARAALPHMAPGEFFCVGPALSPSVHRIRIGSVQTSHPEAGTQSAPPTPPRAKIRAVLAKLADLPAEAEEEQKTVAELRSKIRDLETRTESMKDTVGGIGQSRESLYKEYMALDERANKLEKRVLEVEFERDEAQSMERLLNERNDKLVIDIDKAIDELTDRVREIDKVISRLTESRNANLDAIQDEVEERERLRETIPRPHLPPLATGKKPLPSIVDMGESADMAGYKERLVADGMPAMHRAMLTVLAQRGGNSPTNVPQSKAKILLWSGYARGGATSRAFAELVKNGWVTADGASNLWITAKGLAALGSYQALPKGRELRAKIRSELPEMERKIFDVACEHYPSEVGKQELLHRTGYARGGATSRAFAYLVARDYLVATGPSKLRAAKELFE